LQATNIYFVSRLVLDSMLAGNPVRSSAKPQPYYLLADCGGTFLRLELRTRQNKILHRTDRRTAEFASLSDALKDFFSNFNVDHKDILMCVSIAAKVLDNKVVAQSNIPWPMADGNQLKEEFGFKESVLLNDFEACAFSVPTLDFSSIATIKGEGQNPFEKSGRIKKMLLVGPGTGYGISMIVQQE